LIAGPELIVVNQNVSTDPSVQPNGEILQYQIKNGTFAGAWVPSGDSNAPFAPRGAVLKDGVLYVAVIVDSNNGDTPGEVLAYAGNGDLLGELTPPAKSSPFHPKGVVIGPDGLLYVSNVPNLPSNQMGPPSLGGQVLTFDPKTFEFKGMFIDDKVGGVGHLNRPEGLVFGPDGSLYITSFRASPGDTDSIRIYSKDGNKGKFVGKIDLYDITKNQARAFAQALLFGPGGKLFVPISGSDDPNLAGQVRRYDVRTKSFDVFVPAGTLGVPFYLTFGRTNSATLEYGFQNEHKCD
jgi:hypothetical protein